MTQYPQRVVVIGDSGVGKTSMVQRISAGDFDRLSTPTVGAGVYPVTVRVNGKDVSYHVLDTAGQEMFRTIVPIYFRDVSCCVIAFSFSDLDSFKHIDEWAEIFHSHATPGLPIILVGNKCDLQPHAVDPEIAQEWADGNKCNFFVCSAASGEGIEALFDYIGQILLNSNNTQEEDTKKLKKDKKAGCC